MRSEGVTRLDAPPNAVEVLAGLDLLAPASPDDVRAVADVVDWWCCLAGEELFALGDEADGVYLVVRGRLESHVDGDVLGEIGRGSTVGELAMLRGVRRTASVRAIRDSVVVRLPTKRVAQLAERSPQVSLGLARLVAARAASGPRRVRSAAPTSIAVIDIDGSGAATGLADALAPRLQAMVRVRRVTADEAGDWMGAGGEQELTDRLADAEDAFDAVLMSLAGVDDADRAAVATVVLRQVDIVVAVAEADGRVDQQVLDLLGRIHRPVSLVVVHRRGRAPKGTARWLDALGAASDVRGHVHVTRDDADDHDRLARTLIGRSLGVVLGGGGSRGFAHIGVLRALREAGLHVDRIGGSSMGAIMGAQAALGWTPEEMLERNVDAWSRRRFIEVGLPTLSLLRGHRAMKVLESFFGDRQIEDLWLDCFCTTVDLSVCRLHVAQRGPVVDWVRASATVPGLWPPLVDHDGHLHVDGGMLDNVPTDRMRSMGSGHVIGVDVCHRQSAMRVPPSATLPGGFSLVRARQRGDWFPSIFDVMNRSNLLASMQQHEKAERYADLYLTPPVEEEGFAAFDRVGEIADMGYRYAIAALEETDLSALT